MKALIDESKHCIDEVVKEAQAEVEKRIRERATLFVARCFKIASAEYYGNTIKFEISFKG
jgi:hypothetical protein